MSSVSSRKISLHFIPFSPGSSLQLERINLALPEPLREAILRVI